MGFTFAGSSEVVHKVRCIIGIGRVARAVLERDMSGVSVEG